MKPSNLGLELRRLRTEAGLTLRGLAAKVEVSPAHLSDIEHNRRRPSDDLLRRIVRALRKTETTLDLLRPLLTGIDPDLREWAASTPGVQSLLRTLKESGWHPLEILPILERAVGRESAAKKPVAGATRPAGTGRSARAGRAARTK